MDKEFVFKQKKEAQIIFEQEQKRTLFFDDAKQLS